MDPMERLALERKRIEMPIAVHNSARQKAEKYGIQWEDALFVDGDNGNAGADPVGGLEALWRHLDINEKDVDEMEWEGDGAEVDSSDEWTTEVSGSASGGGITTSSGEWQFSNMRPRGSAEEVAADDDDDFMLEDFPEDSDDTLSADCSSCSTMDASSGGDEPEAGSMN